MIKKFETYHSINENLTQARAIIRRKFSMDIEDIKNLEAPRFSTKNNETTGKYRDQMDVIKRMINDLCNN